MSAVIAVTKPDAVLRKKTWRPRYVPTEEARENVAILEANGVDTEIIAKVVVIGVTTLHRYNYDALTHGRKLIAARIGGVLA